MKNLAYLLSFILLFSFQQSKANHLLGGEITYAYKGSNGDRHNYEVTLSFFADCYNNIPGSAYGALIGANPEIVLLQGNSVITTRRLTYVVQESNIEITPVCPDEEPHTACKSVSNPIPGITKYVYRGTFELNGTHSNWRFAFNGSISGGTGGSGTLAGRSDIINNAVIDNNTISPALMFLEATLNNTFAQNNSIIFTSLPTPFFCLNRSSSYSLGAADIENDSLSFTLIPGKTVANGDVNNIDDIDYYTPYTAITPLPTAPGNFSFSNVTGQMMFTPNIVMNCLVTNLVEEYRNGVKVGSCMREMTFVILDNCSNDPVNTDIDSIKNATVTVQSADNLLLTICEGQEKNISFEIDALDPNSDNVKITYSNLPSGATITVDSNNTPNPYIHFNWNVVGANPGIYIFYITYTDDGCPLVTTKTIAYTVHIVPHALNFNVGQVDPCENVNNGMAWIIPEYNGPIDYKYRWVNANGDTLKEGNHLQGDTLFNLAPGIYTVYTHNSEGCGSHRVFEITSTNLPTVSLDGDTLVCARMPVTLAINEELPNLLYTWSNNDTGCCIVTRDSGMFVVTASNHCGSVQDSARVEHIVCNYCLFVPNAFSPNADGKNDRFSILATCELRNFEIQIFNRWGQRIYTSFSINNSWDGTYSGKPADVGVYFYLIRALPIDPEKDEILLKGDITLLR